MRTTHSPAPGWPQTQEGKAQCSRDSGWAPAPDRAVLSGCVDGSHHPALGGGSCHLLLVHWWKLSEVTSTTLRTSGPAHLALQTTCSPGSPHSRQHQSMVREALGLGELLVMEHGQGPQQSDQAWAGDEHCGQQGDAVMVGSEGLPQLGLQAEAIPQRSTAIPARMPWPPPLELIENLLQPR